jgi:hypothetical protein
VHAGAPVWILGDDSPITMMLGHNWPYYWNDFYDTSPLVFQKKVVSLLHRHPPARVVWNISPDAMVFDTVPSVVRVPLLFDWAIRAFTPEQQIGDFVILAPRDPNGPIDLGWWRDRLGTTLDLGHVPAVANLPRRPCEPSADRCGSFLVVKAPPGLTLPPVVDIPVTAEGLTYTVRFSTTPGVDTHIVPLDRLWFWNTASSDKRSVAVGSVNGAEVTLVHRKRDLNVLY